MLFVGKKVFGKSKIVALMMKAEGVKPDPLATVISPDSAVTHCLQRQRFDGLHQESLLVTMVDMIWDKNTSPCGTNRTDVGGGSESRDF